LERSVANEFTVYRLTSFHAFFAKSCVRPHYMLNAKFLPCDGRNFNKVFLFLLPQASMVDSINENTSVCSWEAVDEQRSAPSSGSNSANTQQGQQILWVPDHAVSRCQGCQIEFWLGRRKHHCRSCGNIFCADCSEFWAPLPDERLFTPVQLCASCYQNVTGKVQVKEDYRVAGFDMHIRAIAKWSDGGDIQNGGQR